MKELLSLVFVLGFMGLAYAEGPQPGKVIVTEGEATIGTVNSNLLSMPPLVTGTSTIGTVNSNPLTQLPLVTGTATIGTVNTNLLSMPALVTGTSTIGTVNVNSPVPVTQSGAWTIGTYESDRPAANIINLWGSTTSISAGATVDIVTYTVPAATVIRIDDLHVSVEGYAKASLYIATTTLKFVGRANSFNDLDKQFGTTNIRDAVEGDVIKVTVRNEETTNAIAADVYLGMHKE